MKMAGEKGFWFKLFSYDEDDRFLNIIGKFVPNKKGSDKESLFQHFREKMKDEDFKAIWGNKNSDIKLFGDRQHKLYLAKDLERSLILPMAYP